MKTQKAIYRKHRLKASIMKTEIIVQEMISINQNLKS